jgi:hypothetical protein
MRSWKKRAVTILASYAVALAMAAFAAPRRETPFTATAVATWVNFGTALDNGTNLLMLNAKASAVVKASDPRVAGTGTVTCSGIWHTSKVGLLWGSFRWGNLGGTWECYWQGTNSLQNGHVVMCLVMTAEGNGVYQGLVFRATSTAADSGPMQWTGCILNDRQGPRPYQSSGLRIDRAMNVTGMLLDPLTLRPTGMYRALEWIVIGSRGGEASYLGRTTEEGLGLLDPVTGVCSMMGTAIPADSEQRDVLHWVAQAKTDLRTLVTTNLRTGVVTAEVHFAGGTGRFEDATGGFSGRVAELISPTPAPTVFHNTFQYEATGTIRFSGPAEGGD